MGSQGTVACCESSLTYKSVFYDIHFCLLLLIMVHFTDVGVINFYALFKFLTGSEVLKSLKTFYKTNSF